MAALAPIPSASVMTTVAAMPLARIRLRSTDADVLRQRLRQVEPAAVPHAAHRIAGRGNIAKLAEGGESGSLRALAALDPLLRLNRQVAADLVVQIAIVGSHGPYSLPAGFMMRPMAPTSCDQRSRSRVS